MSTTMSEPTMIAEQLLQVRRVTAHRGEQFETNAAGLEVRCPLIGTRVLLERCAFCVHSKGLLLNPGSDELTLRCDCPSTVV